MITKQMIKKKLDNLTEEQLKEIYGVIEQLNNPEKEIQQSSLMTKLQKGTSINCLIAKITNDIPGYSQ